MNDNAKMIYGVLADYMKAFPNSYRNLSVVFIDPSELHPIIASFYKFIEVQKKKHPEDKININIKILVKPENKGGRNYLAYWMDECFSQDANVSIKTYLKQYGYEDNSFIIFCRLDVSMLDNGCICTGKQRQRIRC